MVAQSALNGYISAPKEFDQGKLSLKASIRDWTSSETVSTAPESSDGTSTSSKESSSIDLIDGFPEQVEGEIVFCDLDNINTDL